MLREHRNNMDMETSAVETARMVIGSTILPDPMEMISSEICLEICFVREQKAETSTAEDFITAADSISSSIRAETMDSMVTMDFTETIPKKGENLEAEISLTFDEAAFGCDKMITLQEADGNRTLKVHIPAGIDTGQSVRLRGKGHPGIGGGEPGDLLLRAKVGTKPGYERKGADVYTTVNIPYTTAALGGEARVSTLYGDVSCKIKEGTQSGSKIRLRGKGIVSMKNPNVHGDQYVTVQIQVPRHLNQQARRKLMEYKQACG